MLPSTLVPRALNPAIIPTPWDNENIKLARELFQRDTTLDPQLRDTIANVILVDKGLPDAGRTANIIIQLHDESDHAEYNYDIWDEEDPVQGTAAAERSILCFPEAFVAGMNFLRNYEDEYSMSVSAENCIGSSNGEEDQELANLEDRCPFRLGPLCEITGDHGQTAGLKFTNILPYDIGKGKYGPLQEKFWDLLSFFWSLKTVEQIKAACTRPDVNSQGRAFSNGILMSSVCRKSFNALEFYLLPILDDYTPHKYNAQFHWVHKPHQSEQMLHNFRLFPFVNDDFEIEYHTICTGNIITFETTDPVKYPLPDPGLLLVRALLTKFSLPMESAVSDNMIFDEDYEDFSEDDKQSMDGSRDDAMVGSIKDWLSGVQDGLHGEYGLDTVVEE